MEKFIFTFVSPDGISSFTYNSNNYKIVKIRRLKVSKNKKVFVFDLDDTLIGNVHDYANPILDSCRLIIQTLGNKAPHITKIITLEHEIDKRRIKEINPKTGKPYLFSMERFPGSQVETYKEICRQIKISPNPEVEKRLYNIGLRAFDKKRYLRNIKPEALPVLKFLHCQNDILFLLTKGDGRVQKKKISALKTAGLLDYFSLVRIVEDKTPDDFKAFAENCDCYNLYSVGNSYYSDIVPALDAHFKGILIPYGTWETIGKMEQILAEVDQERCVVLKNLNEIMERYSEL